MSEYELTHEAAEDLQEVFDYTIDRWGMRQARDDQGNLFSSIQVKNVMIFAPRNLNIRKVR